MIPGRDITYMSDASLRAMRSGDVIWRGCECGDGRAVQVTLSAPNDLGPQGRGISCVAPISWRRTAVVPARCSSASYHLADHRSLRRLQHWSRGRSSALEHSRTGARPARRRSEYRVLRHHAARVGRGGSCYRRRSLAWRYEQHGSPHARRRQRDPCWRRGRLRGRWTPCV